jgi:hypothetical protein
LVGDEATRAATVSPSIENASCVDALARSSAGASEGGRAPVAVSLAPVDELGVHAERDVVEEVALARTADVDTPLAASNSGQCGDEVFAVEAWESQASRLA